MTTPTPSPRPDDDFEDMLAGFDRILNDKVLQQQLLDAGLLVRISEEAAPAGGLREAAGLTESERRVYRSAYGREATLADAAERFITHRWVPQEGGKGGWKCDGNLRDGRTECACGRDAFLTAMAALAASPSAPPLDAHEPGDYHRYGRIECEVCGLRGTLNLSIEPQRAYSEEGAG